MQSNQTAQNNSKCASFTYNANVIPALYYLMFPVALLLNGVAAWVSLHLKSTTTFVVYLKNLVAADILMTLIIPIKTAADLPGASKVLFKLSCRYFSVLFYSTMYTCITFLGLISIDRFFKIMTSHGNLFCQNVTFGKVVSGIAWVALFGVLGLPNIILTDESAANSTQITSCMQLKGPAGLSYHTRTVIYSNAFFWMVSVIIVFCYICITNKVIQSFRNSGSNNNQGKQKIKLRVFLVIIVLFVSFGPFHIYRIPYTFNQVNYSSRDPCSLELSRFAKEVTLWLATTNICMDPLLYVFLCREFKEKLMHMMANVSISLKAASAAVRNHFTKF